ncbi:hypothetical protein EMIHUDRAFT_211230 [Emiliania huxleyi CCMP1516]|uniref:Uncharacterized protein n=2 Tax=Emiliania huxleyi TaxID=2903 RepID=A0A0D3IWN5_EMIH1|nr:hypothetical protein EMIHUDRAFT_211230 [Emiliania huxleyi CCMP1516]EOD15670.1 hypothetical protein EMIHUDRAFT_211230 [Emiliania huxleyi CCMP1516]|eukprot:XP_005768099.1 hypothetical protein EMIHUDRAFT_211230 [Emiliania huxleyi CCMP1516]
MAASKWASTGLGWGGGHAFEVSLKEKINRGPGRGTNAAQDELRSSPDADDLEARLTELDLAPPPLCHQRSQEWAEPVYRSASIDPSRLSLERGSTSFEEYEEEPVYRSAFSGLHLDASAISDDDPYYTDERFHADWGFVRVDDPRHSRIGCCSPTHGLSAVGCPATTPDAAFVFDLPCEIFDHKTPSYSSEKEFPANDPVTMVCE